MKAIRIPGRRARGWVTALILGIGALAVYAHAPLAAGTATTVLVNPQPDRSAPPTNGLVTNYDGALDSGAVRLRGYSQVAGGTLQGVQITLDGVVQSGLAPIPAAGGPWSYNFATVAAGNHTVIAQAVFSDSSLEGATAENTSAFVMRNDVNTKPVAQFEFSGSPTFTNSINVVLSLTAEADGADTITGLTAYNADPLTDAPVGVSSSLPITPGSFVAGTFGWALDPGVDGMREVVLSATDSGGHTSVLYKRAIVVDTTVPTLALNSPAVNAFLGSKSFNVTGSATDALSGVASPVTLSVQPLDSMDNPAGSPTNYTVTLAPDGSFTQAVTVTADGRYSATLDATDNVGNNTSISRDFTVASTPPSITITAPTSGSYVTPPSTISAIVTDPFFSSASISIDGNPVATTTTGPGANDHTITAAVPTSQGSHTATVTAVGLGGATNTASVTFIVDTAPPNTTIFTPITIFKVPYGDVSFTGRVTDSLQLASWTLTLQNTGLGTAPITVAGGSVSGTSANVSATIPQADFQDGSGNPNSGPYRLILQATDAAGKTDPTPATINFTVDVPPIAAISAPTSGQAVSGILVVRGHITEDTQLAQWELFLDGTRIEKNTDSGTSTDLSVPVDTHTLADGSHTLQLTATDYLGQVGTASVTFTVDNTAPVITFTAPAANAYVSNPVTFTATIADASTVTWVLLIDGVQVDTGTGNTVSSTQTLTTGKHRVELRATDTAGSVANSSHVTRNINVAGAGPTVNITLPKENTLVHRTIPVQATVSSVNPLAHWVLSDNGEETLISGITIAEGDLSGTSKTITYALDTTNLTVGSHTLVLTVTDAAGQAASDSVTIRVDNGTPTVDITVGPPNKLHQKKTAVIGITFNDTSNVDGLDLSYISVRVHQGGVGGKSSALGKSVRQFAFGGLVDPDSGAHLERFVSPGTVGNINLPLDKSKFPVGNYTVEVTGVQDLAGNKMAPTTFTFHVSK